MSDNLPGTKIVTVPNLLSVLRLALIPVYARIYLFASSFREFFLSGAILAFSCITDYYDGRIARKYHAESTLGRILDPIADKATQLSVILLVSSRYPAVTGILPIFILKECVQLIAGSIYLISGKGLSGALPVGKLSTAFLFVSLIILMLFPNIPTGAAVFLSTADTAMLSFAFLGYVLSFCLSRTNQ